MKLFQSPQFNEIRTYLMQADNTDQIFLYVPYIQTKVLSKLLESLSNKVTIITTWEPNDLLSGSSELELYPFCRENKITLYVNNKIHLKVYSVDHESAIITSGNISNSGLMPAGNYECGTIVDKLSNTDRLYFEKIRNESRLVDGEFYERLSAWYNKQPKTIMPKEIKLEHIVPLPIENSFLISALPMTRSVDELISGYEKINLGVEPSDNPETAACIFHDLANYNIEPGLTKQEFEKKLRIQFFSHPFIRKIDEFIDPEAYFGSIKEWIQNNCVDVPIPSRRELTGNVQVLYEWFEKLGDGRYVIDVPSHSQRITKVFNNDKLDNSFPNVSEEIFERNFVNIMETSPKDTTYKFAFALFLIEYTNSHKETHVEFSTIAEYFLKYYWQMECKLKLKQSAHIENEIEISKIIQDQFETPDYAQTFNEIIQQKPKKIQESINQIRKNCFHNVTWRFQKIDDNPDTDNEIFFHYKIAKFYNQNRKLIDLDYGIYLNPQATLFFKKYKIALQKKVILELAEFLKKHNPDVPNLIEKINELLISE